MGIEGLKQRLDQPRLGELLAIQPNSRRVGPPILEAQAQEAHEREPVADLILDLVVREVVERLQNQRLEDDDLVPRLASGRVLPFLLRLAPNRARLSAEILPGEILPGHDRVQDNQRVLLAGPSWHRDRDSARQGRRTQADPFLSLTTKPAGRSLIQIAHSEKVNFSRCP